MRVAIFSISTCVLKLVICFLDADLLNSMLVNFLIHYLLQQVRLDDFETSSLPTEAHLLTYTVFTAVPTVHIKMPNRFSGLMKAHKPISRGELFHYFVASYLIRLSIHCILINNIPFEFS